MNKITASLVAMSWTTGAALAGLPADDATVADLRNTVADLQQQVHRLQAASDEKWLTEQRATEIRGLIQDVLADADTRASLLQGGMTAGYDKGFLIGSADGNYLLKVAGQLQFRFVYNNREESGVDGDRWGFENRRTKLRFFGNVVDPTWQYLVHGGFDRDDEAIPSGDIGNFVLDEAYITKDLGDGMKLRFGQFKAPFLREELISSSKQPLVERSLVNEEFNQDRVQGIEWSYRGDNIGLAAAYSDGFYPGALGTDNTPWQLQDTEFAFTGRGELLVSGEWKDLEDLNGWRGGGTAVLVGAAVHYQKDEYGSSAANPFNGSATEVEALHLTGDVTLKFDGVGLYGAIVYRDLDVPGGAGVQQLGFIVQGGAFLSEDIELFARYEWADADTAGVEDLSVITVGVNKYWAKHNLKWQSDVGFGLNEVASIWSTSSAGWRTDAANDDGQIVVRSQLQLLF